MADQDRIMFSQSTGLFGPIEGCTRQPAPSPAMLAMASDLGAGVAANMMACNAYFHLKVVGTTVDRFGKALEGQRRIQNQLEVPN